MKAAIIAIGSELLGTAKLDNNSLRITAELERFGVELIGKSTIGDDESTIGDALTYWVTRTDMIVLTGGLGPTTDDVTRSAVAGALGKTLSLDPDMEEQLRHRFARMGRHMAEVNRKQAMMIASGTALDNARGTAPGIRIEHEGTSIFLFPGVPREVDHMIEGTPSTVAASTRVRSRKTRRDCTCRVKGRVPSRIRSRAAYPPCLRRIRKRVDHRSRITG